MLLIRNMSIYMKKLWIWIIVILLVAVIAYIAKNKIASLSSGVYQAPTQVTTSGSPSATTTAGAIITTKTGSKGDYLVGTNGMTLYTYDKDTTGVSNCSGVCLGIWPAYTTTSLPAKLPTGIATITRSDKSIQFTYKGRPLYYYTGDNKVGDMNGDGFGGIWHIVKP